MGSILQEKAVENGHLQLEATEAIETVIGTWTPKTRELSRHGSEITSYF